MKDLIQQWLGISELERQLLEVVEKLNNEVVRLQARLDSLEGNISDNTQGISELQANPLESHNRLKTDIMLERLDRLESIVFPQEQK